MTKCPLAPWQFWQEGDYLINAMLEAVQAVDIDIYEFYNQLPGVIRDRCMRVSLATELLLRAAFDAGYETVPMDFYSLRRATLFYDVGFALVPRRLLQRYNDLSTTERRVVERHCRFGGNLLEKYRKSGRCPSSEDELWRLAAETALSHHERWDGTGFPNGQLATATSLVPRAVALSDAYEGLIADASRGSALSHDYALLEITQKSGTQFDPNLAHLFVENSGMFRKFFTMEISPKDWLAYRI